MLVPHEDIGSTQLRSWHRCSALPQRSSAQQNPVTAIDIALEPDATMIQHAKAANARLLKVFPKGFALDATHHPHVSMLQQFVRTADLDKVYAAAGKASGQGEADWMETEGDQILLHPHPADRPCRHRRRADRRFAQAAKELIDAVAPFTVKAGTAAAFMSTEDGRDIQPFLIEYVANFVTIASGKKFNPHVTIGVATEAYLKEMLAEPFQAFTFSPAGASVYQLGSFGTARRNSRSWS